MKRHLVISVRFLDDRYHGLTDNGEGTEWPPSPFRLFQALIAGNVCGTKITERLSRALAWLEGLDPPTIVAPPSRPGMPLVTYVPNNNVESRARTPKVIRPTLLNGDRLLEYGWTFDGAVAESGLWVQSIVDSASHLQSLGWGIDLAIGRGEVTDGPPTAAGRRVEYRPTDSRSAVELRVPTKDSLQSLVGCHDDMLKRYESPDITDLGTTGPIYKRCGYTAGTGRPAETFRLYTSDGEDSFRYPHARLICIAGMTRHAAKQAMENYPPGDVVDRGTWLESFVVGHRRDGVESQERFSYIPLPSIGHEHADAMIRRVMIAAPFGHDAHLAHLAEQLDGVQLEPEDGSSGPVLNRTQGDSVTRHYFGPSSVWASVTPVILPGHDDHKPAKTVGLINRALLQSGIQDNCEFTWGAIPNFPHCLTAHKYGPHGRTAGYQRPKYLEGLTAVHVRITFGHPVEGPLCVGAGRHCGLGVLAAV